MKLKLMVLDHSNLSVLCRVSFCSKSRINLSCNDRYKFFTVAIGIPLPEQLSGHQCHDIAVKTDPPLCFTLGYISPSMNIDTVGVKLPANNFGEQESRGAHLVLH